MKTNHRVDKATEFEGEKQQGKICMIIVGAQGLHSFGLRGGGDGRDGIKSVEK